MEKTEKPPVIKAPVVGKLEKNNGKIGNTVAVVVQKGDQQVTEERPVLKIPLDQVQSFTTQPRGYFNPETLNAIAESMRGVGQLQPGIVKLLPKPIGRVRYELIDGERRLRACHMVPMAWFRAIEEEPGLSEIEQFKRSVVANCCREDLAPIEIARAIHRLREEGKMLFKEIAGIYGKSEQWVTRMHSILGLHPDVLALMDASIPEKKRLTVDKAVGLLKFPPDFQVGLAKKIVAKEMKGAQAKQLIRESFQEAGVEPPTVRPDQEFRNMLAFTKRTEIQLRIFAGKQNAALHSIVSSQGLQSKMELSETLEELITHATTFKKKLDAVLQCAPKQ